MSGLDVASDRLSIRRLIPECHLGDCQAPLGNTSVILVHTNVHAPHSAFTFVYCSDRCADRIVANFRANQPAGVTLDVKDHRP